MTTHSLLSWAALLLLAGSLTGAAPAAPTPALTFDNVPAAKAAARLASQYGVAIVLQGHFGRHVTFTLDNAEAPTARLEAVNALANAVVADYTKMYVVSKAADDAPAVGVDTTATLPFNSVTLSAKEAIETIAAADDATAQIAPDVDGTVTLSGPNLTVAHAAAEIAQQTHTQWKAVYVLAPHVARRIVDGKVIGHTNGGSPIVEYAYVYYPDRQKQAQQQREADKRRQENQQALAEQQTQFQQQVAQQMAQQMAFSGQNGFGYGSNPYSNPYATPYPYGTPSQFGGGFYGATAAYSPGYGQGYGPGNGSIVFGGTGY